MSLRVTKLKPEARIPELAYPGEDIGYDLFSAVEATILNGGQALIDTGIAIEFSPKAGAELGDRSSMALKRIYVNGGKIDAGYRDSIRVILENRGENPYLIRIGDKIAQLLKKEVPTDEVVEVEKLSESKRNKSGFGSSGT